MALSDIRVLIVDDEPVARQILREELELFPDVLVDGEAANGKEALRKIAALNPELVFLDVQMPGMSGLEVARALSGRCHLVFVTAFEQYALQAFEHAAVDYLLKPVEDERLAEAVERLRARLATAPPDLSALLAALARQPPAREHLEWLQVQDRKDLVLVTADDVDVFQASEKYTLVLSGDQEWIIRTPLQELEDQLDPARFWRVHRNAIVRVGAVGRVSRNASGQLVAHLRRGDRTIPVSRAYAHRFKQM